MKTLLKKITPLAAITILMLLGMSCSTFSERHPNSTTKEQDTRWANPIDNYRFERIQGR